MADKNAVEKVLTETQAIYRKANFYIMRTKWQQLHGRSKKGQLSFYEQLGISRTAYGRVLADEIELSYPLPGHLIRKMSNSCFADEAYFDGNKLIKIGTLGLADWKSFFVNSHNSTLLSTDTHKRGRNKLSASQKIVRDCVLAENFEEHRDSSIRNFSVFAKKDIRRVSIDDITSLLGQITIENIEGVSERQFDTYFKVLEDQYRMAECVKKYKAYKNK